MIYYQVIGLILLLVVLSVCCRNERYLVSGSFVFFTAFYIHAFLSVAFYEDIANFNESRLGTLFLYNSLCFTASFIGYYVYFFINGKVKARGSYLYDDYKLFGESSFNIVALFVIIVIIAVFVLSYINGDFSLKRGLGQHNKSTLDELLMVLKSITYSLMPALLYASLFNKNKGRNLSIILIFILFLSIFILSSLTFGRRQFISVILISFLTISSRSNLIRIKYYVVLSLLFFIISFIASFRMLGLPISEVTTADLAGLIFNQDFWLFYIKMLATTLPGQSVFSNLIVIADETGYFLGETYFKAALSILQIKFAFEGEINATHWYRVNYGGAVLDHGYGFTMIGESYLNFGILGFIVFVIIGFIVGFLSKKIAITRNPFYAIWSAICIVGLIMGFREELYVMLRYLIYFIMPLLFLRYIVRGYLIGIK